MNDPVEIISRYLDNDLSAEEQQALIKWVEASADHAELFASLCQLECDLQDELGLLGQLPPPVEHFEMRLHPSLFKLSIESIDRPTLLRACRWAGAAAAIVLMAVTLWLVFGSPSAQQNQPSTIAQDSADTQATPIPTIATVIRSMDAQPAYAVNTPLKPGYYAIDQGYVELKLSRGATVLLRAPCEFELIDDNKLYLFSGELSADVPEAARYFTVQTPSADIVDLGTRFGMKVDPAGNVQAAVFGGEVIIQTDETSHGQSAKQMLRTGQAIHATMANGIDPAPRPLAHDHGFLPTWRDINGHVQVQGQGRYFVDPPSDIGPEGFIDPNLILFQEKTAELPFPVEVLTAMVNKADWRNNFQTLPTGTKVVSYMLHFYPGGEGGSAEASFTFPGRVLGLATKFKRLTMTNEVFALDSVAYVDEANTDFNYFIDGPPADQFEITGENENILTIKLSTADHSDQARVLIAVPAD